MFSKEKKGLQKSFSGNLQFIGVARIFDWGGPNHKSHAMTSSKITGRAEKTTGRAEFFQRHQKFHFMT